MLIYASKSVIKCPLTDVPILNDVTGRWLSIGPFNISRRGWDDSPISAQALIF